MTRARNGFITCKHCGRVVPKAQITFVGNGGDRVCLKCWKRHRLKPKKHRAFDYELHGARIRLTRDEMMGENKGRFQKGNDVNKSREPWNKGKRIRDEPKYDGYRGKIRAKALVRERMKRLEKARLIKGSTENWEGNIEQGATPYPIEKPKGIIARIKSAFGLE